MFSRFPPPIRFVFLSTCHLCPSVGDRCPCLVLYHQARTRRCQLAHQALKITSVTSLTRNLLVLHEGREKMRVELTDGQRLQHHEFLLESYTEGDVAKLYYCCVLLHWLILPGDSPSPTTTHNTPLDAAVANIYFLKAGEKDDAIHSMTTHQIPSQRVQN